MTSDAPSPAPSSSYEEKLWPSATVWILVLVSCAGFTAILAPVSVWVGLALSLASAAAVCTALVRSVTVVKVSEGRFTVGKASIPASLLRDVEFGEGMEARLLRGAKMDGRSFQCLRGGIDGVVSVKVDDPRDPTPAWVVSSRYPEALAAALVRAGVDPA